MDVLKAFTGAVVKDGDDQNFEGRLEILVDGTARMILEGGAEMLSPDFTIIEQGIQTFPEISDASEKVEV